MAKAKIKCYVTGKKRNETPEEKVRQKVAQQLVEEYGYPIENIDIEFSIQRGSKKTGKAIDIVIFHSDNKKQTNIFLIIEVKAPSIITYDDQLFSYASATTATWCIWTNGSDWNYWKTNFGTKMNEKRMHA